MSPATRRTSAPHPDGRSAAPHPAPAARPLRNGAAHALGGAVAASLGLGLCAVVVLLLWVGAPYPQGGPGGALHVAACLWLAAHGADLLRTSTVTGEPVPVELTPLLLLALPVWLLSRAIRNALQDGPPTRADTVRTAGAVAAGYLLVGVAAVCYAGSGPVRVDELGAGVRLGLTALVVAAAVTWLALGRPAPPLPGATTPPCLAGLRAAGLGTAVLTGGGLLLTVAAVAWHGGEAPAALEELSGAWPGDVAVVLLTLALLPNAAVWAASYGLGPGFTLGGGSVVAPLATTGHPQLPHFPLLAGLPSEGPGGPLTWATGALPLAAAVFLGWYVGRAAAPVPAPVPRTGAEDTFGPRDTALTAALGACGCGLAMALLAALAGGALGTGTLAHVGPSWWLTGAAALCWTVGVGTPTALAVRAWRLRERGTLAAWARWGGRRWRRPAALARSGGPVGGQPSTSSTHPGGQAVTPLMDAPPRGGSAGAADDVFDVEAGTGGGGGGGDWHDTAARRTRWAALKESSGGLMNEFPPRGRD